jgi:Plasmid pRiA4b ORF-3-like protein
MKMKTENPHLIYQFKITLQEIAPPIWRSIQVPAGYSFWDLHVAIQDSMGWLKGHAKNYYPYKPDEFLPDKVHFDNPKKRWKIAFSKADKR